MGRGAFISLKANDSGATTKNADLFNPIFVPAEIYHYRSFIMS